MKTEWIQLTSPEGHKITINPDHISMMQPWPHHSAESAHLLTLISGQEFYVTETASEIIALIKNQ